MQSTCGFCAHLPLALAGCVHLSPSSHSNLILQPFPSGFPASIPAHTALAAWGREEEKKGVEVGVAEEVFKADSLPSVSSAKGS